MIAVRFPSLYARAIINESSHTVELLVPLGTDVTDLSPEITHTGAGVSPSSGSTLDFTNPVTYTVTAKDGSTQSYTISVITNEDAFISVWDMSKTTTNTLTFPLVSESSGGTYDFTINWGDGTVERCTSPSVQHEYATAGTFMVTVVVTSPQSSTTCRITLQLI